MLMAGSPLERGEGKAGEGTIHSVTFLRCQEGVNRFRSPDQGTVLRREEAFFLHCKGQE